MSDSETEEPKTPDHFRNLLEACGLDETKLSLLLPRQSIWMGDQISYLFAIASRSPPNDLESISKHILDTNRISKIEGEFNKIYEEALKREDKGDPAPNGFSWSISYGGNTFSGKDHRF